MKKKILISTGGSGGHVIPAMILQKHLNKNYDVIISTDTRGYKYLEKNILNYRIINTPKLSNIFFLPFNLLQILILTFKSIFLLKNEKIDKVISTGGYMSLPLILASILSNLKFYLLEPNFVLGRANKFFLKTCVKILCYTDKIKNFSIKYKKKIFIISPLVREEFYQQKNKSNNENFFNLLVVGGSQGASIFDNNLKQSIVNISKKFPIKITQQTNQKNVFELKNFYLKNNIENKIFNFDKDFINILEKTDLCITRAGASTLAELAISNIPFIAVPLSSAKDNHQLENANFYKEKNCCWILDQLSFEEKIEDFLRNIIIDKDDYLKKKREFKKIKLSKYLD